MAPATFVQRPARWLRAISDYRATHSASPNFGYELCLRKVSDEDRESLDLRSLKVAMNGAEPVRAETLVAFAEAFEPCGLQPGVLCPGYGLAEATLSVATSPRGAEPVLTAFDAAALYDRRVAPGGDYVLPGYGPSNIGTEVVIADPSTGGRSSAGHVGEIWIRGATVAAGYWHQAETTQETFGAHLADTGDGPFMRTGDLGFHHEGHLYLVGRLKDVVIIRGRNHYPQDLELTAERAHAALRPGSCAAVSIGIGGEEALVIVQEVHPRARRTVDVDEVALAIQEAVSHEHDLEVSAVALIEPNWIPKTSSGKIQRQACRIGVLEETLREVGRWVHPEGRSPRSEPGHPQV